MTLSLDTLRRQAKSLRKAHERGDAEAAERLRLMAPRPAGEALRHADYLHVIAREAGFDSWPRLKFAAETLGLDRAERLQALRLAVFNGRPWAAEALLADDPALAEGAPDLAVALYDRAAVEAALAADPGFARAWIGRRTPMLHLAFSYWFRARPDLEGEMLAIAELLLAHGADLDEGMPWPDDPGHRLSPLYGAIGHTGNMALADWLLRQGANPNDNESLYHATELGHHRALKLLLAHGAAPSGTNALLRAMDFHDHEAVRLLLAHGARPDDFNPRAVGGAAPAVIPALHQAARRMSDGRMVALLLEAGAEPGHIWQGAGAYAMARAYGNRALAEALEARGAATELSREERLLAAAAEGSETGGARLDPKALPEAFGSLMRELVHLPEKLAHMRRLVALGLPFDAPDGVDRIPPVQVAGWEGKPEVLAWLLSLGPDLDYVNGYGGTLLSTILHGAEHCPARETRDHIACARLALEAGVALPRVLIERCGREDMAEFLVDWAEARAGAQG
ncbi:MAG: ankyrin repeat domain-containing protein [Roseovarius sp.]